MISSRTSLFLGAIAMAAIAAAPRAQGPSQHSQRIDSFRPVASFNLTQGIAEIVDVANQGRMLVYTNAASGLLGFVDITNPSNPTLITTLAVGGEPTSVSVLGNYAFATVWVDGPTVGLPAPAFLPGQLVVVDLSNPAAPTIVGHRDIGYHPDSIKVKRVGAQVHAVIAIENEPIVVGSNGLVTSSTDPGNANDVSPAGLIQVVRIEVQNPANSVVTDVALPTATMQAAGCLFPSDPQPEYVAWHGNQVAVTLQENNGIAVLDLTNPNAPQLVRIFSTGSVAPRPADLMRDSTISFTQSYPTNAPAVVINGNPIPPGVRMPDGIAFSPDGSVLFTADEGEVNFTGGRGFSSWRLDGTFVGDDGGRLEEAAKVFSHYPEPRSAAKGIEAEGVATGRFGNSDYAFVLSERGSFMAVYDIDCATQPRLVQILPTGLSPEGVVTIPQRNLVVTADEVSGTLSIFQGQRGDYRPSPIQPVLYSADYSTPWAALSGLCAGFWPGQFFSVPDNALPTQIFSVQAGFSFAPVRSLMPVLKNGVQARYDAEGLCRDHSIVAPANRGFWIASEGNASSSATTGVANLLVQVDGTGNVLREIQLPRSIDIAADATLGGIAQGPAAGGRVQSNGFEGCALSTDGRFLFAAVQREFAGEFSTGPKFARIARYDLQQLQSPTVPQNGLRFGGDWQFFYYQFETNDPINWPGLSEITTIGTDRFLVIERDKGVGAGSTLKRIYAFTLAGLSADTDGLPDAGDTVTKILVRDCVDEFSPYEKIEGIGVSWGSLWVGLDNDGGALESRLRRLGWLGNPFGN